MEQAEKYTRINILCCYAHCVHWAVMLTQHAHIQHTEEHWPNGDYPSIKDSSTGQKDGQRGVRMQCVTFLFLPRKTVYISVFLRLLCEKDIL